MSDLLLLYGTTDGYVQMFGKHTEEEYESFNLKSKEFVGNAVTCMDVHSIRTDYVVLGYLKGQMVLFDCTNPAKPLKTIKDNHKGIPVIDIKFCDYYGKQATADESNIDLNSSHHNMSSSRIGKEGEDK